MINNGVSQTAESDGGFWNRVSFVSFCLAVMVVIRHNSTFANYDWTGFPNVQAFLKGTVAEIAVPTFFLLSGFNFFVGYDLSKQKGKLLRRVKSLVVPYLLWNTVYCAFAIVTSYTPISRFFIGREAFHLSFSNVLLGCLFHENCNGHFWFIFELLVFVLVNPLFYFLIRNRWLGLVTIGAAFVCVIPLGLSLPTTFFYRTDSVFYYLLGAYLALHFGGAIRKFRIDGTRGRILSVAIGLLLLCSTLFLQYEFSNRYLGDSVRAGIILVGGVGLWMVGELFTGAGKAVRLPSGGTVFLIYAMHGITQPILVKLLTFFLPDRYLFCLINFVLSVALTVLLCFAVRLFTKKYLPVIDHLIVGWRR